MPYVRQPEVPFARVRRLLLGYELDTARLAGILGCSLPTARSRLANPQQLTLGELERISRLGHVPMAEIKEAIIK